LKHRSSCTLLAPSAGCLGFDTNKGKKRRFALLDVTGADETEAEGYYTLGDEAHISFGVNYLF
jgi:hypothetical protein